MPAVVHQLSVWRLQASQSLAWALLLAGESGLGSLAHALASGPLGAFALTGAWLLAIALFTEFISRLWLHRAATRASLPGEAGLAVLALRAALHGDGWVALVPALLTWAALIALASTALRPGRCSSSSRLSPKVGAAAAGAVLAWVCVGDITNLDAL